MSSVRPRRQNRITENFEERDRNRVIDELEQFEKFKAEILPVLRKEISKGTPAEEIYKKFEAHLAARAVTIAMTETDTSRAMAAIREALDRSKGKAVERKEITRKYENLSDAELEALAKSKREQAGVEDGDSTEH